ncbi:MAG: NAD+ synthase, partial [Planctomycetota bacterium]
PYDILDRVLEAHVEDNMSREEIAALGFDPKLVDEVVSMVERNEYKRRQAPPGLKISGKAFGFGRRLPIAADYRGIGSFGSDA